MGDHDAAAPLGDVLPRLSDPATSTRRTAAARARLVDHPTTRALLEAGVRVLLDEVGASAGSLPPGPAPDGGPAEVPARFFELLSARRVCRAATAVGPLQVTPSHLRDRWAALLSRRLRAVPLPTGPQDLPRVAESVARACVVTGALPVTVRLEVMASALAPVRPRLRATRASSYARLDAGWSHALGALLDAAGLRVRAGHDLHRAAADLTALVEGATLRMLALGESPERREQAVRLVTTGLLGL